MWYQSAVRVFSGVASILLGLVSLPMTNLGGIGGFLLAIVGGGMAVAWAPGTPAPDVPGEKAELPDGDPTPQGDGVDPGWPAPTGPAVSADPFTQAEPVHAGARADEDHRGEREAPCWVTRLSRPAVKGRAGRRQDRGTRPRASPC